MDNVIESFKTAMLDAGIEPPDDIIPDGQLQRFKIDGKLNGAYVLHLDGRAAGYFEDFKQGIKQRWKAEAYNKRLSDDERKAFAEKRKAEQAQRLQEDAAKHEQAANKARYAWSKATPAIQHPYLIRKGIQPHGAKIGRDNSLILPIFNYDHQLVNLQFIAPDGQKRFMSGGQKKACFWWVGSKSNKVLIAEGYATACSISESTGQQCFIAFDAGNLENVAKVIRAQRPNAELIIMADNDLSGVGQTKARLAALATNCKYMVCPSVGQDFNDFVTGGRHGQDE